MTEAPSSFRSFFQVGFECSTHRNSSGKRLDLLQSTGHDRFAFEDYRRVRALGIRSIRLAARWHRIEASPGQYDFSSLEQLLNAADANEIEIILDVLHFGWPDHIDIFASSFSDRFANFTAALARYLKSRTLLCPFIAPVNEISYLSWAGGEKGCISPFAIGRGDELKRILVRSAVAANEVLLNEIPDVRLISPEPVIHIVGDPEIPGDSEEAESYTLAQYQSWDMLAGRLAPELGGKIEYLDVIGVNYYARNEWVHNSGPLSRHDPRFRPFRSMLQDVWRRYGRPLFVSETGTEDDARANWFDYVCQEVQAARSLGVPILGICLYPVLNHPGWDDDRHCHNGLFDYPDARGHRQAHEPLVEALLLQQKRLAHSPRTNYEDQRHRPNLLFASPLEFRVSTTSAPDEPLCTRERGLLL